MAHNKGYNIPAFGHTSHISSRSKSRASEEENPDEFDLEVALSSNISTHTNKSRQRQIKNTSHISTRTAPSHKSYNEPEIKPLHDPMGKPLRRHGTETIGDILMHPIKEMQLFQKRHEAYEAEKNAWNEKHPESIASAKDEAPQDLQEVRVRLTMHFRHLVGEQHFKFTDEQIAILEKPVRFIYKSNP